MSVSGIHCTGKTQGQATCLGRVSDIPASVTVSDEGAILFEHQLADAAAVDAELAAFVVLLSHFEQFVQDHFGIGIGELCADPKQ